MSRARHSTTKKAYPSRDERPHPRNVDGPTERVGLLSFTLAPSPVVRWILPARIRSPWQHDVVFIGNTYIQLREFQNNGQLSDATAKLDFGTPILSAKVISAKAEMVPIMDAVLNQEWDEERFVIGGKPCANDQPPQILVLATASSELIYVYAKSSDDGKKVELVFGRRALLADVSIPERHLRHMAIDPECKIMAVASYNSCTVFSLRGVDDLKDRIDAWNPREPQSFQPNIEQRMFQVDGHILKMDFLRASEEEPEKAILLLVVVNGEDTLLLLYKWDTRESLDQIQPVSGIVQSLQPEDRFPLLLIPSQKRASFAIVTETSIVFYDSVRSAKARRLAVPLPSEPQCKQSQLWVQWAKPSRHGGYSNQNEDILLIREDGVLRVFTRPHNSFATTAQNFSPGKVKIDVDSAVCMLPGPQGMSGDILIVGGSMNDGGVFHLKARFDMDMLQIIPNVSPIHDMTVLCAESSKQKELKPYRTFVTAGVAGVGNLNELRFGHEAQIGWKVPLADGGTANRLWALEHPASRKLYILVSHPEHTSAIALDLGVHQFEEMDPDYFQWLHFELPTLAAAILSSEISVQITSKCISAGLESSAPTIRNVNQCVCADISYDGEFAVAFRTGTGYHIQVGLISMEDNRPSILLSPATHFSSERPMCLALFHLNEGSFLCAGYEHGTVEVFSIDQDGRLVVETRIRTSEVEHNPDPVASITVLAHNHVPHMLILAGTRRGKLAIVEAKLTKQQSGARISSRLDRIYGIGDTQVTVVNEGLSNDSDHLCAFISCGIRLDQIISYRNEACADYGLFNVWLTEKNNLNYVPAVIAAVRRIRPLNSIDGGGPSGFLMCATKEELLFTNLIEQEQMVPRRIGLTDKGARLMICPKFLNNKFAIASNPLACSSETSATPDDSEGTFHNHPTMHIVDPDKIVNGEEQETMILLGEQGEQMKALLPWSPTCGNTHYTLIIIGTSDGVNGTLGFISAGKLNSDSPNTASFKRLGRFPKKKLYSICALGKSALAIGLESDIIIINLDVTTRKWSEETRYALPSPAISLSAQGSHIYAATQRHSTIILNWQETTKKCERLLTDNVARNSRTVLQFGDNGDHVLVTTASQHGTCVFAYSIKKKLAYMGPPLFEAIIPSGINYIKPIPSSWAAEPTHQAFQGIAFDGTVSILHTLTHSEWKLLRFVEQLVQPSPVKSSKKKLTLLNAKQSRSYIRAAKEEGTPHFDPKKMHVQGDVLKRLVEQGPSHLATLVQGKIKSEDDMEVDGEKNLLSKLQLLAKPVVGETSDVSGAVIAWIRRMLRSTIF